MHEENACLRGDRDPNFIGELKTAAAFEALLVEEDLNVLQQFLLGAFGHAYEYRDIRPNDSQPSFRKRLTP